MDHPGTCESYLRNYFVGPLQIPEDRYIAFQSDPENPEAECERIQQILDQKGPIDISRLIILLINGIKKREITQAFLEQKISTELPASLLWLPPNVICLIDREAAHSSN